jgi:hypothetical protein
MRRMGWVEAVLVVVILVGLYRWYAVKHSSTREWWNGGGP